MGWIKMMKRMRILRLKGVFYWTSLFFHKKTPVKIRLVSNFYRAVQFQS